MRNVFYGLAILTLSLSLSYFFYSVSNYLANWDFTIAFLGGSFSTLVLVFLIYTTFLKEETH